jgi:hypothetical protein
VGIYQVSSELLPHTSQQFGQLIISSVWKPLRGPIHDWPLAICDAESVDEQDVTPADVVSLEQAIENMVVHYNPKQRWYYLSNQEPTELLIFRQADSDNRQGQLRYRWLLLQDPND